VTVGTGAWNTGWHHGHGFVQWTGSQAQKDALARVAEVSQAVHEARWRAGQRPVRDPDLDRVLEEAMWHLLRAETSCHIYWGEAWVDRVHQDLEISQSRLEEAQSRL
jgi:hypothetical protein